MPVLGGVHGHRCDDAVESLFVTGLGIYCPLSLCLAGSAVRDDPVALHRQCRVGLFRKDPTIPAPTITLASFSPGPTRERRISVMRDSYQGVGLPVPERWTDPVPSSRVSDSP